MVPHCGRTGKELCRLYRPQVVKLAPAGLWRCSTAILACATVLTALTSHQLFNLWPENKSLECSKETNQSGSCVPRKIIKNPNRCFLLHTDGIRIFTVLLDTALMYWLTPLPYTHPILKKYLRCFQRGFGAVYQNTLMSCSWIMVLNMILKKLFFKCNGHIDFNWQFSEKVLLFTPLHLEPGLVSPFM